jgi:hypothetical protein
LRGEPFEEGRKWTMWSPSFQRLFDSVDERYHWANTLVIHFYFLSQEGVHQQKSSESVISLPPLKDGNFLKTQV